MTLWKGGGETPYFKKYGIIIALVMEMVVLVVIGFWLGRYLDQKLETDPWLLTLGVIFGFVSGIYRFYKSAHRFLK